MKFIYNGNSPKSIRGKRINKGDEVEMPDNFSHPQFSPIIEKKNRNINHVKVKPKRRKKT